MTVMNVLEATNIAVAGGTLVLALFTWKAARAGQQAAKAGQLAAEATQQAAQASRDEAGATIQLAKEARTDRELAWRPHLGFAITIQNNAGSLDPPSRQVQISLSNVGNGPALSTTVWIYHYDTDWYGWGKREDLLVASKQTLPPMGVPLEFPGPEPAGFPEGMFDPLANRPHPSKWVFVATCTDVLGNHWRFVDGHPAEIVRPDDPDPPPWTRWAL